MMKEEEFIDWCIHRHDIVCNQKYDIILPYSYHLALVDTQHDLFKHLIGDNAIINGENMYSNNVKEVTVVRCAIYAHDIIEDARVSYNDIVDNLDLGNYIANKRVAEIVYLCTENKGRNRAERKGEAFYRELSTDRLAVYVKLCDLIANIKYSYLKGSSMYDKYKKEYLKVKAYLYTEEYKEMFDYIEKLFNLF